MNSITNYLTIDVEDYFQIHAFSKVIKPEQWENYECRVEKNTRYILDLLDTYNGSYKTSKCERTTATFFILGWIAERYPLLVKDIHQRGHEIASHGYGHQVIYHQKPKEFQDDVRVSKEILEDLIGVEVIGYRAPTYSITKNTLWTLNILAEMGYKYDSSIFPIRHDYYGFPSAPRFPFLWDLDNQEPTIEELKKPNNSNNPKNATNQNTLIEYPISTVNLFGYNLPCSGGGYFRLLPYFITRKALKHINKREKPFMFYLHPWEMDPDLQTEEAVSPLSRFRTYVNISKTGARFKRLLSEFRFLSIQAYHKVSM